MCDCTIFSKSQQDSWLKHKKQLQLDDSWRFHLRWSTFGVSTDVMILHAAAGVNPLFGQTNKVSAKYLYTHWSELTHILTAVTSNQIQNRKNVDT